MKMTSEVEKISKNRPPNWAPELYKDFLTKPLLETPPKLAVYLTSQKCWEAALLQLTLEVVGRGAPPDPKTRELFDAHT